jgi:hypothetical protein
MKDGEFTALDEFYIVNPPGAKGHDSISVTNHGVNNYRIKYDATQPETYTGFFVQKGVPNGALVTVTYSKLDYGWKLTALETEPYTMNGKTAPELYELAKDCRIKGYLFDVANLMGEASSCMQPSLNWTYPDAKAMAKFSAIALIDANRRYRFPYTIEVSTQPRIISIQTRRTKEGVFPEIYYQSKIKLSNTTGLQKENMEVRKALITAMPGIDKNKKYVYYSVFNKLPSSYESVDRYETIDTLK